ncbi:uncharacterized protein [Halyomorpha halys]|uniref:uncharacterized protein n=1 Tax=Halyomorpha halys TaxID=286706 RepID=UPI0006D4E3AA|nr:uncharacterized protein LOC106684343 [Halyomorpha halys]
MDDTAKSDSSVKEVKRTRPPIKLCFRQKVDIGRSNIVPFRPRAYVHYVTRKFYAPDYTTKCSEETYQKVKLEYENDPKKKYGYPVLESHRYGWYWDVKFHDPDSVKDRRLNFPKTKPPFYFQPLSKPTL